MEKLSVGAESEIIKINNTTLKKVRLEKKYRHKDLDLKLRRFRTKREFKILEKLSQKNINIPKPILLNLKETSFEFEYIQGTVLKQSISKKKILNAFYQIILLHKEEIVHGDLTTLNMIDYKENIYIIDFGLSSFSSNIEERGVDLNLFFRCIENEHPKFYNLKKEMVELYIKEIKNGDEVIKRLKEIELRGRNKAKQ